LESLNDWSLCVENGKRQQVAYIDFAKAFDSVCHNKLIAKLTRKLCYRKDDRAMRAI